MFTCPIHNVNYLFVCFYCQAEKIAKMEGEEIGIPPVMLGFEDGVTNSVHVEQTPPGLTYEKLLGTYRKLKEEYPEPTLTNIVVIDHFTKTILTRKLKRNARRKHKRSPHKAFLRRFSKTILDPDVDVNKGFFDQKSGTLYVFEEGYRQIMSQCQREEVGFIPFGGIGVRGSPLLARPEDLLPRGWRGTPWPFGSDDI